MRQYKDNEGNVFDVMTFQELINHGREVGANIVNDMPWSFKLFDHPITHENDECYLIPTPHLFKRENAISKFTPNDVLLIGTFMRDLTPITKRYFEEEFTEVVS